ncbi:paired amphipathic helix protein Sin3-like 2 isoform X2 [Daucus carota subsp. sativus]|uniref:paired amphipathic helix protein Sin3-like 2 isoform X2 n=1 Tax=Daucus carota subsp. sativus TaxID=79200 RepID=UPI0007EF2164|nr:PREDICTED: paired amphipathic helix protein Sin3-like 2 isoform X2 [Daucus carota subsp. sativus]
MKRARDDLGNSPFKKPFGSTSRVELGQPHNATGGVSGNYGGGSPSEVGVGSSGGSGAAPVQKLTTNDALSYLKEVKEMFQDKREKYDMFLDVMKDFKAQRIDTTGVIARVKELFKGHNNLILGFNTFLPKGYEITIIEEEDDPPKRSVEFEEAIGFVNKIKTRFQDDEKVYKSFLDILNMYRRENKGIDEVYFEVAALFKHHADLLEEFIKFLPDASAVASEHNAKLGRQQLHLYEERGSPLPTVRGAHMDNKQRFQRDKIVAPHMECDRSVDRHELEDNKTMIKLHKEQKKRGDKDIMDRSNRGKEYRDPDHDMHRLSEKRKSARKVENFGGDPVPSPYDDKDALRSLYKQEFSFCDKVKERLDANNYQSFLKCLHIYSTEIVSRSELQGLIADLLGKYPDLMAGFNDFLERCERVDGFLHGVISKKYFWNEGHASKAVKMEDKEKEQRRDLDAAKEKDRFKEKYWGKSIQELDLSNCQRCTPSYRLLPEDYPIPSASQRSELGAQVLNDNWVSVTSGSEDYSFKHMRRNQYEESLFRCEDDRFELDMLLESVSSTVKRMEELLNNISNNSVKFDSQFRIEDHFTALNLRCIERLYGDHGLDTLDTLRKNPLHSVQILLTRLRMKLEEWSKCRLDFNKVWAEVYAKNHYKSLDHRSFYFKQQDSKNLSAKSLVAEIKELKERSQQEDNALLSIAAGCIHPIFPNLVFKYTDTGIHEDIYKLIKYSCDEICTSKEQSIKSMRLWCTFLEPLLSVPSRPLGIEDSEVPSASRNHGTKSAGTSSRGREENLVVDAAAISTKLPKVVPNADVNTSPKQVNTGRLSLLHGDILVKEDGFGLPKEPNYTGGVHKASASVGVMSSAEHPANSDAADAIDQGMKITADREATQKPTNPAAENSHGISCNVGDVTSLESSDSRSALKVNGAPTERTNLQKNSEDSVDPSKTEKEEGELSPHTDFEEDNFAAYGGSNILHNGKKIITTTHCRVGTGEDASCHDGGENDADADDEDSDNVSEAGVDVSGSESAADECSREEHEEDEDGEQDEEGKAESECEAEGLDDVLTGYGSSLSPSERFLNTTKPLAKHVASSLNDDEKRFRFFYGNDAFYVLFRLHQILYERLFSAKQPSSSAEMRLKNGKDTGSNPYMRFMKALYDLLDGSSDNAKFEDDCRAIIGNQSYVLFTLDRLIYKLVKQLQTVANDEMDSKLLQLYEYENSRRLEKYVDSVYYENAHVLLHDENIYRFECTSEPSQLCIQLMDDRNEKPEVVAVSVDPNFATYFHKDFLSVVPNKKESPGILLRRNKCKSADPAKSSTICMVMEGVEVSNGLECKMACSSSKISYVLDTEDFFCRKRYKREKAFTSPIQERGKVQKFHQFLSASI